MNPGLSEKKERPSRLEIGGAVALTLAVLGLGYAMLGIVPTILFGLGFVGGLAAWLLRPGTPGFESIRWPYFVTLALFVCHKYEEREYDFFPALSKLTGVPVPETDSWPVYLLYALAASWLLVPMLLRRRKPFGSFLAWTFFASMGFVELAHFVFPLFAPERYGYFPGMITAAFLAPAGMWGLARMLMVESPLHRGQQSRNDHMSLVFDPRGGYEMPELRDDHPKSDLPFSYPHDGFGGRPIASLRFLLPSFLNLHGDGLATKDGGWRGARTQFEVDGWLITIDRLPDAEAAYESIRRSKEHEWTHEGHIQRADGSEFAWAAADELFNFLYHLFSFSCASLRGAQAIVAFDRDGKFLFTKGEGDIPLGEAKILSWFPEGFENPFVNLAPGFHVIWADPDMYEVAIFVVGVLCEASREKLVSELKFVIAQTGLELMANTVFVEAWGNSAKDAAATKIQGLLQGLKVDIALPGTLPDLLAEGASRSTNYPGESNWADGPQAIVQIRNMATHADAVKRRKLFGLGDDAKFEAALLSIHYLEMAALWFFGYDGPVATRIDLPQILGKHVQSPWPPGGSRPGNSAP